MRAGFLALAVALTVLLSQAFPVFAASGQLTFSDPSVSVGNQVSVTMRISADAPLGASDVMLGYDSSALEFVSGTNANGGAGSIRVVGSMEEARRLGVNPSFVVTGNTPVVIRESLLPKAFAMAEKVVNRSYDLFGGMWGPFCLETVVTDKLEFKVFEISTRIVAGTNPFISGSPYADLIYPGLSTGGRIALEIKEAVRDGNLKDLMT